MALVTFDLTGCLLLIQTVTSEKTSGNSQSESIVVAESAPGTQTRTKSFLLNGQDSDRRGLEIILRLQGNPDP